MKKLNVLLTLSLLMMTACSHMKKPSSDSRLPSNDGIGDVGSVGQSLTSMSRILSCRGTDAKMEIYVSSNMTENPSQLMKALQSKGGVVGLYALDLSEIHNDGKTLEPVRVRVPSIGETLIVKQLTRDIPETVIPLDGSDKVNFDDRFGTNAQCTFAPSI